MNASPYLKHHGVKGQKWYVWNAETRARRLGRRKRKIQVKSDQLKVTSTAADYRNAKIARKNASGDPYKSQQAKLGVKSTRMRAKAARSDLQRSIAAKKSGEQATLADRRAQAQLGYKSARSNLKAAKYELKSTKSAQYESINSEDTTSLDRKQRKLEQKQRKLEMQRARLTYKTAKADLKAAKAELKELNAAYRNEKAEQKAAAKRARVETGKNEVERLQEEVTAIEQDKKDLRKGI